MTTPYERLGGSEPLRAIVDDFVSRVVEGTGHNERDWAARAGEVVAFLLGPR